MRTCSAGFIFSLVGALGPIPGSDCPSFHHSGRRSQASHFSYLQRHVSHLLAVTWSAQKNAAGLPRTSLRDQVPSKQCFYVRELCLSAIWDAPASSSMVVEPSSITSLCQRKLLPAWSSRVFFAPTCAVNMGWQVTISRMARLETANLQECSTRTF